MLVVRTSVPVDPARRDDAIEAAERLAEQSRREAGVVRYSAGTDVSDPTVVRFFEQYEDEAALAAHTETDHYRRFVDRLPEIVDGPVETLRVAVDEPPETVTFAAEEVAGGDP